MPLVIHYKFAEFWVTKKGYDREIRDEIYQKLHEIYSPIALDIIMNMKGMSSLCMFMNLSMFCIRNHHHSNIAKPSTYY